MNDFVVRKRLNEVLGELVGCSEGKALVAIGTLVLRRPEVSQHVMHPSHVPFEVKPQSSGVGGVGYLRKGS